MTGYDLTDLLPLLFVALGATGWYGAGILLHDHSDAMTGGVLSGRSTIGTSLVQNPWALGVLTVQAHGLGGEPDFYKIIYECLTADLGYSVGDKLIYTHGHDINDAASRALGILVDATNISLLTTTSALRMVGKATFSSGIPVVANWKITVTPYRRTT